MEAATLAGTWKKQAAFALGWVAVFAAVYRFPPLTLLLALVLPLWTGPAFARGDRWFAMALPLAPGFALVLAGGEIWVAALTAMYGYACLWLLFGPSERLGVGTEALACTVAFVLCGLLMAVWVSHKLGGPLFPALATYLTALVDASPKVGNTLYRLVSWGFLPLPEAYRDTAAWQIGGFVIIHPGLRTELIRMLRLRLQEGLSLWLPTVLMQGAITVGLLTAHFTQRARERRAGAQAWSSFGGLRLSARERKYVLVLSLATAATSLGGDGFWGLLCTLLYATLAAVLQLQGAAVLMGALGRKHPRRAVLHGLLAAAIFLLFPISLFLLGTLDLFMNLRAPGSPHQEEE